MSHFTWDLGIVITMVCRNVRPLMGYVLSTQPTSPGTMDMSQQGGNFSAQFHFDPIDQLSFILILYIKTWMSHVVSLSVSSCPISPCQSTNNYDC